MINQFRGEYNWLSNFYSSPIQIEGITYSNAESAFQAMKCDNLADRIKFTGLSGVEAKRLGRTIELPGDWDWCKRDFMFRVIEEKFTQNPMLKEKLIATGDQEIIEGNTWGDTYWGVCNGKGDNNLGKIIMFVRKVLSEEVMRVKNKGVKCTKCNEYKLDVTYVHPSIICAECLITEPYCGDCLVPISQCHHK